MAEIHIRNNRAGPQRFYYVLRNRNREIVASKKFRTRGSAIMAARAFHRTIQQGVTIHE